MTRVHFQISALVLTGSGIALIWAFEPGITPTDCGLGCFIIAYVGELALGVGASALLLDGVERAGKRLLIHLLKRGSPHD